MNELLNKAAAFVLFLDVVRVIIDPAAGTLVEMCRHRLHHPRRKGGGRGMIQINLSVVEMRKDGPGFGKHVGMKQILVARG
jgi:hypothetical protein